MQPIKPALAREDKVNPKKAKPEIKKKKDRDSPKKQSVKRERSKSLKKQFTDQAPKELSKEEDQPNSVKSAGANKEASEEEVRNEKLDQVIIEPDQKSEEKINEIDLNHLVTEEMNVPDT